MFFFLFLIFLIVAASLWFHGLWGAGLSLINILIAGMIATNLYEPIASLIESLGAASWTYLLDFVIVWFLFGFSFIFLRLFTDLLSRTRIHFDKPVEMAGRSVLAIWAAWVFVCFTAFSMHLAPLNSPEPLGAWKAPQDGVFFNADRLWLRFMHSRSKGALARGNPSVPQYPGDEEVQAFDPTADFVLRYRVRRTKYAEAEGMRQ